MAEEIPPLANKLMQTSQLFGGMPTSPSGGGSAEELLAGAMGGLAQFDPALAAMAQGNPAVAASLDTTQLPMMLPPWAQDLKILGLGKEDPESPPEMFVFMRDTKNPAMPENPTQFDTPQGFREGNDAASSSTTSQAQTVTRALNQPYLWEEDELREAMERMQQAGLDVKSFEDVNSVWQGLVERAAKTFTFSEGEKKVTPWDVLDLVARENEENGLLEEEDKNFSVTSTNRSVQDISEGEAWSVLRSNLSRMLGRDPSDQEVRDFTYRMSQLAARNPSISKTVSKYKDGRLVSSNTVEKDSGFTADDMLKAGYDQAQNDPQYAEFQAATTYFDATMSALGAIGST